jgi:predicted amidohydrolase
MTKIAAVQISTTDNLNVNLDLLKKYITIAHQNGASHIFTPENSDIMVPNTIAEQYDFDYSSQKIIELIAGLSATLKVAIHIGSIKIPVGNGKYYNQSVAFDVFGNIVARYNKIHLFDAFLDDGTFYYESEHIQAGNTAVTHGFSDLKIGYTICYDLRFGYLYNILSNNNVDLIAIPAAFTIPTGQAHWEVLLRSRAIENCCYVVAAAQCGIHYGKRKTYGHSMIINPWGEIISVADSVSQMVIYADIDKKERGIIQKKLNVLGHRVKNIGFYND